MGLVADSLDMLADALVYALSLLAVGATLSRKQKVTIPKDPIPSYVKRSKKEYIDELFSERALLVLSKIKMFSSK